MPRKFAIIIPYRDRPHHLTRLIACLGAFLPQKHFDIYVLEQQGKRPFNKGKLLNVGFQLVGENYPYVLFHDVDQLPLKGSYSAPHRGPVHLGTQLSQYGFKLPYPRYFGGVVAFTPAQFRKVNGFSNQYWGWGCEDDDLRARCELHGLKITRRKGRYLSLPHARSQRHFGRNFRRLLFFEKRAAEKDGLSDLRFEIAGSRVLKNGVWYVVKL